MSQKKRYTFKAILGTTIWMLLAAGTVVLLVAAINKKSSKLCKAVAIKISGVKNNFFIDNKDVMIILERMNMVKLEGKEIKSINLARMESVLEKSEWIKNAELFFDNNEVLRVNIIEREPVARIFTTSGRTFYLDSSGTRLPLSDKLSARLPVFTNFPVEDIVLSKPDSNLLTDVKNISEFIVNDPFWMAQIDQVNITENRIFEMIPKVGNQIIVFGNADNYKAKFDKLLTFYKEVESKVGWNKYSKIDVQYNGQIVAVKRDAADIKMDSLKAKELMKMLVANAQRLANDSANNIQLIQQEDNNVPPPTPLVNNNPGNENATNVLSSKNEVKPNTVVKPDTTKIHSIEKPVFKVPATNPGQGVVIKKLATNIERPSSKGKPDPIPVKKVMNRKPIVPKSSDKLKPKAVMPSKNDY